MQALWVHRLQRPFGKLHNLSPQQPYEIVCASFIKYSHFTSEQSKSRQRLTPLKGEELPGQISEPMSAFCQPFDLQPSLPSPRLYSMTSQSSESWSEACQAGPKLRTVPSSPSRHLTPNGTWIPAPHSQCLHTSSRPTQTSLRSWLCYIPAWPCEVTKLFTSQLFIH